VRKNFERPSRALIDLRDERDDLSIRLNLLEEDRLTAPSELFRMKRDLAVLERRIADQKRAPPAV
jgi:septation ring formation regulator EzrA